MKTSDFAKNALVLMVVSITEKWKLPIANFLFNTMNAEQKKNVILETITWLQNINMNVVCVTCDGLLCNTSVIKKIEAHLKVQNCIPYFTSEAQPSEKIFVMLDACHMIKLVRNVFVSQRKLKGDKGDIKFEYLESLYKLQNEQGL